MPENLFGHESLVDNTITVSMDDDLQEKLAFITILLMVVLTLPLTITRTLLLDSKMMLIPQSDNHNLSLCSKELFSCLCCGYAQIILICIAASMLTACLMLFF